MTKEELSSIHKEVMQNAAKYKVNKSYAMGENTKILTQEEIKEPNNKISTPYGYEIVTRLTGYAGRNIKISYKLVNDTKKQDTESQEEIKETEYQLLMKKFSEHNNDDILVPNMYTETISQKNAYMLFWTSDELNLPNGMLTPEYDIIESNRGIMIYENKLKPKALYFVLFTEDETFDGKKTTYADIYYPFKSDRWVSKDGGDWALLTTGFTTYPYERVPCIEFKMSKDGGPVFSPVRGLIDQVDKIISKSADELERFANLIIEFPGVVDKDFADKLRTQILTLIDDLGKWEADRWPKYLEKNLQGVSEYQKNLLDWIVDRIHEGVGIPDMMDERFAGGAESGVSREYKLTPQENLAAGIEAYFFKGLYERKLMLDDVIKASMASINPDEYTIEVKAERGLPFDEEAKARVAQMLNGQLSNVTIFEKILSKIVDNPKAEELRLKEQRENNPVLIPPTPEENMDDNNV